MTKKSKMGYSAVMIIAFLFAFTTVLETLAEARAGRGGSMGSRGSRSYTAPKSTPASPSQNTPGMAAPGQSAPRPAGQPAGGAFSRSPFLQGMAGGLAGGLLGSMLFGGMGHASGQAGGAGGGGMGFLDMVIIGLLLFFAWKFFKKRRAQKAMATGYTGGGSTSQFTSYSGDAPSASPTYAPPMQPEAQQEPVDVYSGLDQIRSMDPGFSEESFKEMAQDLFFRIQAGWMNRSLEGIEGILTREMSDNFRAEFDAMKQKGQINRLENIAVRKVELTEAWQEMGKDYITVLFTANLLDYTLEESSGQVIFGDKLNPVKFQEFWTFSRDVGSQRWQLSGIDQIDQSSSMVN